MPHVSKPQPIATYRSYVVPTCKFRLPRALTGANRLTFRLLVAPKLGVRPWSQCPALTATRLTLTSPSSNVNIIQGWKLSEPDLDLLQSHIATARTIADQPSSVDMDGVIQGKALDGTIQPINGTNAESNHDGSIDRAVAEKATLNRTASIPQAGHVLTGRQEHCT